MRGDARNQVIVQARAYAIVRDPNFETLRMLEIKEALEPSKSTRNFPTSGCNMKVCPTEKKLIVNELLDGLTDGDFEAISQSPSSNF